MTPVAAAGADVSAKQTKLLKFYDCGEALAIAREWLLEPEHQDALIAAAGDLDALPELKALLEGAEATFAAKAENVALMVREYELNAAAAKSEVDRLRRIEKTAAASAEGLRTYLRIWFLKMNVKKVEGTRAKPRIQLSNPAVTSALTDNDLSELHGLNPSRFVQRIETVRYAIDTDAVVEAYKIAVGRAGKMPDVGEIDYATRIEEWKAAVEQDLRGEGVPVGITVDRNHHVRIG